MTTARHIVTLLKSHIAGDEDRFLSIAMQLAAHEARQGHGSLLRSSRIWSTQPRAGTPGLPRAVGRFPFFSQRASSQGSCMCAIRTCD